MDTNVHNIQTLFAQLGLGNSQQSIEEFVSSHKLEHDLILGNAPFWSPAQRAFIQESLAADDDWSESIDQLDNLLR